MGKKQKNDRTSLTISIWVSAQAKRSTCAVSCDPTGHPHQEPRPITKEWRPVPLNPTQCRLRWPVTGHRE